MDPNQIIHWIYSHAAEIAGALTGIIYLFLSIRQNIFMWPVGIINVGIYAYVFYTEKLYADMLLQIIYIIISIQGLIYWLMHGVTPEKFRVTNIPYKKGVFLFIFCVFAITGLSYVMKNFTDAAMPLADSVITVVSLAATWMMVYKYLQNWIVWIIIDAFATAVYFLKGLYPTVGLFCIYTIFAVAGYFQWRKSATTYSPEV